MFLSIFHSGGKTADQVFYSVPRCLWRLSKELGKARASRGRYDTSSCRITTGLRVPLRALLVLLMIRDSQLHWQL